MSFFPVPWFCELASALTRPGRRPRRKPRRRPGAGPLRVEPLEDRSLPSLGAAGLDLLAPPDVAKPGALPTDSQPSNVRPLEDPGSAADSDPGEAPLKGEPPPDANDDVP